jgi:hypothetical protein
MGANLYRRAAKAARSNPKYINLSRDRSCYTPPRRDTYTRSAATCNVSNLLSGMPR